MSKYIIEIKPEYEDSFKGLMILGAKDSNLFVDTLAVENLDELNSDYINEHFVELQDEAYQRGLEEGKKATFGLVADASNAEYQKGLNDAWECARKIVCDESCGGMSMKELVEIFNKSSDAYILRDFTAQQAIEMLKAYKQKKDDKIEVGDAVRLCRHKVPYIVTSCDGDDDTYILMTVNGGFIKAEKYNVRKTGMHFDVASILEDMKHD